MNHKKDPIIFIGFCHPGKVYTAWMESILGLLGQFRVIIKGAEGGPLISRARNMLCEQFLKTEADYLLMTDTDVVFEPTDVQALLEAGKPIVGALYFGILGRNPNSTFPVALSYQDGVLQSLDDAPSKLTEVDGVGMGLTLIERSVIESLKPDSQSNEPFAETVWPNLDGTLRHHGEDAIFCLKAKEKGFQTWLEPKARVGHMKTITL